MQILPLKRRLKAGMMIAVHEKSQQEEKIVTKEEIEAFITQFPIYQYAFVKPEDIDFNERVRAICKKECPRYGNSWSCPPAVGKVERCRERCYEYEDVLFFSSVTEVKDFTDMEENLKTKKEHEKMTKIIEDYLRSQGLLVYTLSSDSCSICSKCGFPKEHCRHPEQMHPCIESHGIVVANLVEKCNMDYYMGERLLLWYSMIFFKNT